MDLEADRCINDATSITSLIKNESVERPFYLDEGGQMLEIEYDELEPVRGSPQEPVALHCNSMTSEKISGKTGLEESTAEPHGTSQHEDQRQENAIALLTVEKINKPPRRPKINLTPISTSKPLPSIIAKKPEQGMWPLASQDPKVKKLYNALQCALDDDSEATLGPADTKVVLQGLKNITSRFRAPPDVRSPSSLAISGKDGGDGAVGALIQASSGLIKANTLAKGRYLKLGSLPPAPTKTMAGIAGGYSHKTIGPNVTEISSMSLSSPFIPLANRAVHPLFLRQVLRSGIPGIPPPQRTAQRLTSPGISESGAAAHLSVGGAVEGGVGSTPSSPWNPAGWTTADLIAKSIKPATAAARMSLVQALVCGAVKLPWCPEGRFDGPAFNARIQDKPIHGPATFFVTFSYGYKFEELVAAILDHYAGLPEADSESYVPIYYWISAFAVNCNHGSDIRKNPDSGFESVIHRCRALLLACKPWDSPACLSRAWCLYEVLIAINASIDLVALNLDHNIPLETFFADDGIQVAENAFVQALDNLDIRNAHCSSHLDHTYITSLVERNIGDFQDCAMVLAMGLQPCFMSSLLTLALKRPEKDFSLALQLVQEGSARLQWGPAFVSGPRQGGDAAAVFFGSALGRPEVQLQELVLDPLVSPNHSSGSQGLTITRPSGLLLGQAQRVVHHHRSPAHNVSPGHLASAAASGHHRHSPRAQPGFGGHHATSALGGGNAEGSSPRYHPESLSVSEVDTDSRPGTNATTRRRESNFGPGTISSPHRRHDLPLHITGAIRNSNNPAKPLNPSSIKERGSSPQPRVLVSEPMRAVRRSSSSRGALDPDWSLGGWANSPSFGPDGLLSGEASTCSGSLTTDTTGRRGSRQQQEPNILSNHLNPGIPPSRRHLPAGDSSSSFLPPMCVTAVGAEALALALTENAGGHLVTLSLSNNNVGSAGACSLFEGLHINFTLKTLLLRNNSLDGSCSDALGKALSRNTTLTCLDLGENTLCQVASMEALARGLLNSGLRDLRLDSNGIELESACALVQGLSGSSSLQRLDLSKNLIVCRDESRSEVLASGLAGSTSLQSLVLAHNQLGSLGVLSLAGALVNGGKSLHLLDVRANDLGLETGLALAELLGCNPPLSCLDMSDNPLVGSIGVESLARGLQHNSNLVELRLRAINMNAAGAMALAIVLSEGARGLRRLDVSENNMGNAGAEALANHAVGAETCRLHELHMERCGIRAAGRLSLVTCIQANSACTLRHLHLGGNRDPDADPTAGAKVVYVPPALGTAAGARGGGQFVIAEMSRAEQLLAQALNIGRQLRAKRHLHIHDDQTQLVLES